MISYTNFAQSMETELRIVDRQIVRVVSSRLSSATRGEGSGGKEDIDEVEGV